MILRVNLASNDRDVKDVAASLLHHPFHSVADRLCILATRCVALLLCLEIYELVLEECVKYESGCMLAKEYITKVISTCPSNILQLDWWMYVLPS
jgi:hypothetical protein